MKGTVHLTNVENRVASNRRTNFIVSVFPEHLHSSFASPSSGGLFGDAGAFGLVGAYTGDDGAYTGDVGTYAGDVGLYEGDAGTTAAAAGADHW